MNMFNWLISQKEEQILKQEISTYEREERKCFRIKTLLSAPAHRESCWGENCRSGTDFLTQHETLIEAFCFIQGLILKMLQISMSIYSDLAFIFMVFIFCFGITLFIWFALLALKCNVWGYSECLFVRICFIAWCMGSLQHKPDVNHQTNAPLVF